MDLEDEKRKDLGVAVLIGTIILFAVIYFVWNVFINKGTLKISAETPFTVEIFDGETFTCDESPCEIKQKPGLKTLQISKEGFLSQIKTIDFKRWSTEEINLIFELEPYIEKIENFPAEQETPDYEMVFDEEKNMQKLVNKNDELSHALAYFPRSINADKIFGGDSAALIITTGKTIYRVNFIKNTREKISGMPDKILWGIWSPDAKSFVFKTEDSPLYWILNEDNGIWKLDLETESTRASWTYFNELVFITSQSTSPVTRTGNYSNYVSVSSEKITSFNLGYYHPGEDSYGKLSLFSDIKKLPDVLVPLSNNGEIYYKIGEENFKIILRKF